MRAHSLYSRGTSGFAVLALALLLASCIKSTPTYQIGGAVSGLSGAGLVLQNNGGDNLGISASGAFTFSRQLKRDASYNVTVSVQPAGQTCTVTNGSGTVTSDVTNVAVNCPGGGFTVGGTVSGLTGTGLVLRNNGGNNLPVAANGAFTFSMPVASGGAYSVTVLTQPSGQTCTVSSGTGSATANVTSVAVACVPNVPTTFTVGGAVSGLAGTGLVLQNNGANNLAIASNGSFTFSTAVANGAPYSVTVLTQPSGQTCTVSSGTGNATANVTSVAVACISSTFSVGGAVSGVTAAGLVLQNNGSNNLAIASNGSFTFSTAVTNGAPYSVTVLTPPTGEGCAVANSSGIIAGANVINVAVTCVGTPAAPIVSLAFGVKELQFSWPAASRATFYRLLENPDGVSGYSEVATNIAATSYNYTIPVHERLNASYIVEACNVGGCTDSVPQSIATGLTQAIGYAKASNTGAGDQFGISVAVSGDGNTLAVGAPMEDSGSTGINSGSNESASNAGAVYVFAKIAGAWSQQAYVKASNTAANDGFGYAVALSGDGNTLAVGARGQATSGAAYVFTRSTGAWSEQAFLKASNAEANDSFGSALALSRDGNTLAVGAPFESSALTSVTPGSIDEPTAGNDAMWAGAVYVYARSGTAWSQQAYVKASNAETVDLFGSSVAISGDGNTLAVGAPLEGSNLTGVIPGPVNEFTSGNLAAGAGAVYVYIRTAGAWSMQAYVKASNTGSGDNFGNSVALSGDASTLAVGAPLEASSSTGINSTPNRSSGSAGAVYVFDRLLDTWSQQAYVKASNTGVGDQFGTSVALSGDGNALAVGAPFEDSSTVGIGGSPDEFSADSGTAYFYTRTGSAWSEQAYVKSSNTGDGDNFGTSVALSDDGNTLAVGAPMEDGGSTGINGTVNDNATNAGAMYLY